jgi:hypothetical protein
LSTNPRFVRQPKVCPRARLAGLASFSYPVPCPPPTLPFLPCPALPADPLFCFLSEEHLGGSGSSSSSPASKEQQLSSPALPCPALPCPSLKHLRGGWERDSLQSVSQPVCSGG